jgi:hypothetical protein
MRYQISDSQLGLFVALVLGALIVMAATAMVAFVGATANVVVPVAGLIAAAALALGHASAGMRRGVV